MAVKGESGSVRSRGADPASPAPLRSTPGEWDGPAGAGRRIETVSPQSVQPFVSDS